MQQLKTSRPYLEFLLERASRGRDLTRDEPRREFLHAMLAVAAQIPDPAARDQFADRLAHRARVTEDVVRSLVLSQRLLGTQEIVLIHHTDCGLQRVNEDEFKREIEAECGIKPWWAVESFRDPFEDVRQSIGRLHMSPFIVHKDHVRGFVYDVTDGRLHEVTR